MGQSRPLFVLFSFFSHHNFNTNLKKHRWCAWDSNPGPQDGRHRQNHGAMAATPKNCFVCFKSPKINEKEAEKLKNSFLKNLAELKLNILTSAKHRHCAAQSNPEV